MNAGLKRSLVLIGVVVTVYVAAIPLLHYSGRTTPDSRFYLGLAANMQQGSLHWRGEYNPVWPIGYSTLIAGASTLSRLDVWAASKLVNILVLWVSLFVAARLFGDVRALLVFLFASFLTIFSSTWSEAPLLLFILLGYSFAWRYLRDGRSRQLLLLAACVAAGFLFRYVGLCVFAFFFLIAYRVREDPRRLGRIAAAALLSLCLPACYLFLNYRLSGTLAGSRGPAPEPALERLGALLRALSLELNPMVQTASHKPAIALHLLSFAILIVVVVMLLKRRRLLEPDADWDRSFLGLGFGFLYLAAIIVLRWFKNVDLYDFRLLAPGILPIYLALLPRLNRRFVIALAACSLLLSLGKEGYKWRRSPEPAFATEYLRSLRATDGTLPARNQAVVQAVVEIVEKQGEGADSSD